MERRETAAASNPAALLPTGAFWHCIWGWGWPLDTGLAFYSIPIVVVFMVSLMVSIVYILGKKKA